MFFNLSAQPYKLKTTFQIWYLTHKVTFLVTNKKALGRTTTEGDILCHP